MIYGVFISTSVVQKHANLLVDCDILTFFVIVLL